MHDLINEYWNWNVRQSSNRKSRRWSQLPVQLAMISSFNYHFPWSIPNCHSLHFHSNSVISASPFNQIISLTLLFLKTFLLLSNLFSSASLECIKLIALETPVHHRGKTSSPAFPFLMHIPQGSRTIAFTFFPFILIVLYYLNNSWLLLAFSCLSRELFPARAKWFIFSWFIFFFSHLSLPLNFH